IRVGHVTGVQTCALPISISGIAGVSVLVGMLVLGIPYALPLAILLAVIDLIPMVGVTLGAVPVLLAALAVSPVKALILLAYIIRSEERRVGKECRARCPL